MTSVSRAGPSPLSSTGSLDVGPVSYLSERITAIARPPSISIPLTPTEINHVEASVERFCVDFNEKPVELRESHRTHLETAIRSCLWADLRHSETFLKTEWIIRFTVACVEAEIADCHLPFALFHEACDWGDSREKEQIANLFVDLKAKWRSPRYSVGSCRNILIRFTTELLSRLPKTSSARARGRLLCYVSARIPMSDKSAANPLGELNNGRCPTTEGMTTGTANNTHENVKFLQLCNFLDYLKNPNLILTESGFFGFKLAFESLVELMTPVDMTKGDHEEGEDVDEAVRAGILTTVAGDEKMSPDSPRETRLKHVRFIADPASVESDLKQDRVKRNLLTRFLVVVQYFCLPARPKAAFEPTYEQLAWCDQVVQTALAILSRTNPSGPKFVERLTDHLESEAAMSIWKDSGCPPLPVQAKTDLSSLSPYPLEKQLPYAKVTRVQGGRERQVLRKSIRDLTLSGSGKTAGCPDVSKMLNRGPNTAEEFQNLGYQPPPIDFFIPVVEQAISGAKLKAVLDEKFQWRALRILGKRTHIHFSNEAEKMDTKDIGSFIENYVMNLAERNPILQAAKAAHLVANPPPTVTDSLNGENDEDDRPKTLLSDNLDDLMDQEMPGENGAANVPDEPDAPSAGSGGHSIFSKDQIRNIASLIAGDWEKFAAILNFGPDSTEYWKSAHSDPVEQAVQMLQVWMETLSDSVKDSNEELGKFLGALKDDYGLDFISHQH